MISKSVYLYCKEDASLIENYKLALNDKKQTWDVHHRLETDLGLSSDELKEQNRYFNVPASELIFLTKAEHQKLHQTGNKRSEETKKKQSEKLKAEKNPMWGKNLSEERKHEISICSKDRTWMNNGITHVFPKTQEEIDHYRELGYTFGRIYKRKK